MLGEILRKKREELGKDLREISEILKIKYAYLKALEEDDLKNLPAEVYVKAYLISYAKLLELDPEEMLKTFNRQTVPQQTQDTSINTRYVQPERKFHVKYFIVPALVVFVAFILAISLFRHSPENTPVVARNTVDIPRPSVRDIGTQQNTLQSLEIKASEPTWLQVIADRTQSQDILMQPGESFKFQAKNSFSLKIGNAGGLRVFFNGKDIGKLGDSGQVIRLNLPENGS